MRAMRVEENARVVLAQARNHPEIRSLEDLAALRALAPVHASDEFWPAVDHLVAVGKLRQSADGVLVVASSWEDRA